MIELIIAYDNRDSDLGNYFDLCRSDLESFFAAGDVQHTLHRVGEGNINQGYVDIYISSKISPKHFFFVAYSHGSQTALHSVSGRYVIEGINTTQFSNCFFYSNACSVGDRLGSDLVNNGCHAFIGYKKEINKWINHTMPVFIECDNFGIKSFCRSDISAYEAYTDMYVKQTEEIDKLVESGDALAAADLRDARDSLIFYGVKTIKLTDLYNQVV
jgi:hypothetical protein